MLGGVALNRKGQLNRKAQPKRKLLGASIPPTGSGAEKLARQIGKAAFQLGRLATEVQSAREQAAKVGKAMS